MSLRFEIPGVLAGLLLSGLMAAARLLAAEPADSWGNLFEDTVIARGKGVEIKRSQLEREFIAYKANLTLRGQPLPEAVRSQREADLLDRLIINRLIISRATDADQARSKEMTEKFLAELKKNFPSEEAFLRRLKIMDMTPEQYEKSIREQALADAVIERELRSKIAISEAQVRELYDKGTDIGVQVMEAAVEKMAANPETTLDQLTEAKKKIGEIRKSNLARLERPEMVRVIHLLLATSDRDKNEPYPPEVQKAKRQLAEKLLVRARGGEDFAKLVNEYSEDRGLVETKGEYTFARNARYAPEFKAAAFSLQTNQVSDVVVTTYGFHLIKLLEKIPAQKAEYAKAQPELKEFLVSQELQKQMPDFFDRLRKEAAVEILDPRFQPPVRKPQDAGKPAS